MANNFLILILKGIKKNTLSLPLKMLLLLFVFAPQRKYLRHSSITELHLG